MSESIPSSKVLLKDVLLPHMELAVDLMGMVKTFDTRDPTHRYQIASILIFLAGVDKTLNLAFELLYLAGKVDWKWMVPNPKPKPPAGFIECTRGLTAKIMKLKDLGVDITHLQWLINLRNEYIHSCSIYTGYSQTFDEIEDNIQLKPSEPTLFFPLSPIAFLSPQEIQYYANEIVDLIGSFIDRAEWQKGWFTIAEKVKNLPKNPEPEYTHIMNEPEKEFEILDALNEKFVGDGAKLLLK